MEQVLTPSTLELALLCLARAKAEAGTAGSFLATKGDVITGFTTGTDKINLNGEFLAGAWVASPLMVLWPKLIQ